jgi:hypothetical protein
MVPTQVSFLNALLASASCAIPGIPVPSAIKVPTTIQSFDSLTAWLVFVLYAGPVASLFPDFQKEAIAQSAANYAKLRDGRSAIYRFLEPLRPLRKLVRENPQLANLGKAAIQLKASTESEVRQELLSQPSALQALANSPVIADFMRTLGAPIPDLRELTNELTPTPVGESAPADGKPEAVHNASQDRELAVEEPVANSKEGEKR